MKVQCIKPNIETTLDDKLLQSVTLPLRVLVFTTLRLLRFLTMGVWMSITMLWGQLFILMVEY